MSVVCVNSDCPEYNIEKDTTAVPDDVPVQCGGCGGACQWPDGTVPTDDSGVPL